MFEISPGKREGFIDVTFESKPSEQIRTALKQAGFRWSPRFVCWYGPADRFPLGDVPEAQVAKARVEAGESPEAIVEKEIKRVTRNADNGKKATRTGVVDLG